MISKLSNKSVTKLEYWLFILFFGIYKSYNKILKMESKKDKDKKKKKMSNKEVSIKN